jgi:hypothetical protein
VRSAAEERRASTPVPPSRKKTGGPGRPRPPATRVYAAPVAMDDGSEVDLPATPSQDRNPPAVTHARRQAQAPNKSTSARRSVHTSHRIVPDDEEEVIEEDITDQEDEDEDDIYGGVDGAAVGDALGKEVRQLPTGMYFRCMSADDPNSYS